MSSTPNPPTISGSAPVRASCCGVEPAAVPADASVPDGELPPLADDPATLPEVRLGLTPEEPLLTPALPEASVHDEPPDPEPEPEEQSLPPPPPLPAVPPQPLPEPDEPLPDPAHGSSPVEPDGGVVGVDGVVDVVVGVVTTEVGVV